MRGKGHDDAVSGNQCGITPAYAGKSAPFLKKTTQSWDHPRVCGEKRRPETTKPGRLGSPPRMRGKVCSGVLYPLFIRITPAYAGKRISPPPRRSESRDHPRVCGEKVDILGLVSSPLGSPPRMRGKGSLQQQPTRRRITPAYAGKSDKAKRSSRQCKDHPRVCGEKHLCAQF